MGTARFAWSPGAAHGFTVFAGGARGAFGRLLRLPDADLEVLRFGALLIDLFRGNGRIASPPGLGMLDMRADSTPVFIAATLRGRVTASRSYTARTTDLVAGVHVVWSRRWW